MSQNVIKKEVMAAATDTKINPLQLYSAEQLCGISANLWSRPATALLIEMYRKLECLWKTSSPYYRHKKKRHEALQEIAIAIEPYRPDTTVEDVKNKINGLRTQYVHEKNKILMCSKTGNEVAYEPTLWCYDRLSFLASYTAIKNKYLAEGTINISSSSSSNSEVTPSKRQSDTQQSVTTKEMQTIEDDEETQQEIEVSYEEIERLNQINADIVEVNLTKTNNNNGTNSSTGKFVVAKKRKFSSVGENSDDSEDNDNIDIFLKFVACQMKLIKDQHLMVKLQHTIQTAIMDTQRQQMETNKGQTKCSICQALCERDY